MKEIKLGKEMHVIDIEDNGFEQIELSHVEAMLEEKLGTQEFLNLILWNLDSETAIELMQDIVDSELDEYIEVVNDYDEE